MTERERVILICREIGLPPRRHIVNGSGSMIMHGITAEDRGKPMGDLDLFTTTRDWWDLYWTLGWSVWTTDPEDTMRRCDPPYLVRWMHGLEVNVFQSWRRRVKGNFDVPFYLLNSVEIDGILCAPLQFILDWKREVGRGKDAVDIGVLERYLGAAAL